MLLRLETVLSFVSLENTEIQHLQFIIQTPALETMDVEEVVEIVEANDGFIDRLWALFSPLFSN